jgi:hypothetical protein
MEMDFPDWGRLNFASVLHSSGKHLVKHFSMRYSRQGEVRVS